MTSKPRVIRVRDLQTVDCSDHVQVSDEDLLIDDKGCKLTMRSLRSVSIELRYVYMYESHEIPRNATVDLADPLDYYSNLLAHPGAVDSIELDPANAVVRQRYPWVNAFWFTICVHFATDGRETLYSIAFYPNESPRWVSVRRAEADIAALYQKYTDRNVVHREVFMQWTKQEERLALARCRRTVDGICCRIQEESLRLEHRDARRLRLFICYRAGRSLIVKFDGRYAAELEPLLTLLPGTKDYLPLQTYINQNRREKTIGRFLGERTFEPRVSQWLTYHRQILDCCVAFGDLVALPPYVWLEIFDWLPYFCYWKPQRKLDMFMSIRRSIESVLAKRLERRTRQSI